MRGILLTRIGGISKLGFLQVVWLLRVTDSSRVDKRATTTPLLQPWRCQGGELGSSMQRKAQQNELPVVVMASDDARSRSRRGPRGSAVLSCTSRDRLLGGLKRPRLPPHQWHFRTGPWAPPDVQAARRDPVPSCDLEGTSGLLVVAMWQRRHPYSCCGSENWQSLCCCHSSLKFIFWHFLLKLRCWEFICCAVSQFWKICASGICTFMKNNYRALRVYWGLLAQKLWKSQCNSGCSGRGVCNMELAQCRCSVGFSGLWIISYGPDFIDGRVQTRCYRGSEFQQYHVILVCQKTGINRM